MNIAASIKKVFDYIVWVAFFGFLLLGVIIYITNTTYPGDRLYPFKLKFEDFVLATSKILNKQVDFSIDLVSKRSQEVAKILSSKNSADTLSRLDVQVELTAVSISQISDPVERKEAAEEYIVKLNEASIILSEKEKDLLGSSTTYSTTINTGIQTTPQPTTQLPAPESTIIPTATPIIIVQTATQPTSQPTAVQPIPTVAPVLTSTNVSQQINNSQTTIQQTISEMKNLATESNPDSKRELKQEILKKMNEKGIDKEDIKNIRNKKEDD
ncbi:MAG: hypothetical protein NUV87_02230 [Candidatus Roizmanbacteria bacterium]|nr:hypothetical protein [Candidatus Roizmanbacteria bacterium]